MKSALGRRNERWPRAGKETTSTGIARKEDKSYSQRMQGKNETRARSSRNAQKKEPYHRTMSEIKGLRTDRRNPKRKGGEPLDDREKGAAAHKMRRVHQKTKENASASRISTTKKKRSHERRSISRGQSTAIGASCIRHIHEVSRGQKKVIHREQGHPTSRSSPHRKLGSRWDKNER